MLKPAHRYYDYLIIALIVVIAYWQVSFFQYTIKCDASLLSLPWKKFVSDSLRSGYFPIWNPYINLGWTQGMEPSSWYYPSWIFALFGKYRLSYLHTEIVLHLILGGIGTYKLLSLLKLNRWALVGGSLIYILSGFFVGNFQHLGWTFYGCWLPLVLYYFFLLIKQPEFKTALKFGFTGAMLVLSSYIPFIITTFIFLVLVISFIVVKNIRQKKNVETLKLYKYTLVSVLILFIICAPAFYMLYVNMDTMYRGGRYDDNTASFGSLVPNSWISLIYPFGTTTTSKMWSGTDISMNNIFIGIISIFLIGFSFASKEKKKIVWVTAAIGILALLFSFGSYILPTWYIFRHLPFYEKLRFASQFRIYFILAACILAAIGSDYLLKNNRTKQTLIFAIVAGVCCLIFSININHMEFYKNFNAIFVNAKNDHSVIESLKFQSLIWGVLFIVLTFWLFFTRKKELGTIKKLIGFNILFLLVAVQMNMFYTGVANESVSEINKKWLKLPDRFHPIQNKSYKDYWNLGIGQTWTNTGTLNHVPNIGCYHPYDSKNYGDYMNSGSFNPQTSSIVFSKEQARDEQDNIVYIVSRQTDFLDFNPYRMKFTTNFNSDTLNIQMSPTPSTKVLINEKPRDFSSLSPMIELFNVPKESIVVISFLPKYAKTFAWFGIICFLTIVAIISIYEAYSLFRRQ